MKEKKWCVYCHTNKVNGKKYIGITSLLPIRRWGLSGQGYKTQYFKRAIDKYGWDNFEHEILFENIQKEEAKEIEIELILKYKTKNKNLGYNLTNGGEGSTGVVITEETRQKLIESHLGQVTWNKGMKGLYKQSEEAIKSHLDKWKSEEYINKQTLAHMGNKQSEETKRKIRENNKKSKTVCQIDICGNIIKEWKSYAEICREFINSDGKQMKRFCCNNVFYDGYIWIQKEKYTKEKTLLIISMIKNNINVNTTNKNKRDNINRKNKNKIIEKYDKDMCLLQTYKSISLASFENNIDKNTIKKYYTNGKIYGDVYFRVKEEL